jgi:hypothetical protein
MSISSEFERVQSNFKGIAIHIFVFKALVSFVVTSTNNILELVTPTIFFIEYRFQSVSK